MAECSAAVPAAVVGASRPTSEGKMPAGKMLALQRVSPEPSYLIHGFGKGTASAGMGFGEGHGFTGCGKTRPAALF